MPELAMNPPMEIEEELSLLSRLNDNKLWVVAHSTMDSAQQERLAQLTESRSNQPLSPHEKHEIDQLLAEAQRVMLRKAEAFSQLAQRGYLVFSN